MNDGKILIVDDNEAILESLSFSLKHEFNEIHTVNHPSKIEEKFQNHSFDIILLDMNFTTGVNDGKEGMTWLKKILELDQNVIVILITAYGDVELAVQAMKEGATDFVLKPWDTDKLIATLKTALKLKKSEEKVKTLQAKEKHLSADLNKNFSNIIGSSEAIKKVLDTVAKVAKTDANILILGENGTGKEIIAREIHRLSERASESLISVDMASLSETLFESELFGHVKGAFTDAKESRAGRFETASGSSLFLDEIGNLSISMQAKILTALQNREVYRLGSSKPIPIDIRLICATNKPLYDMVQDGLFREDLLYRINTIQVEIPPLREREGDIIELAEFYLKQYVQKYNKQQLRINTQAFDKLMKYHWPGNVRELQHTVEKAVILSDDNILKADDFYFNTPMQEEDQNKLVSLNLEEIEKQAIKKALKKFDGNLSNAAKELGISRTTLYTKISKYGLQ
ncbi:MAG: sigma-54-dependent transcriptional regulator [Rhodothermaceae bacterium]